jgi:hypothetical protein
MNVTVTSERNIYEDPADINPPLPKYQQTFPTSGGGTITINNLEWGAYRFSVQSGYTLTNVIPYQPVTAPPGGSINLTIKVTTDSSWPTIDHVVPISGVNNAPLLVEIYGTNLPSGATMELRQAGQPNVVASGVISSGGNTKLEGTFDLTGIATGLWDVVVISLGETNIQPGGFTVAAP